MYIDVFGQVVRIPDVVFDHHDMFFSYTCISKYMKYIRAYTTKFPSMGIPDVMDTYQSFLRAAWVNIWNPDHLTENIDIHLYA